MFRFKFGAKINALIQKVAEMGQDKIETFKIWSNWEWEHWRVINNQLTMIDAWRDGNVCTDEGLTNLLDVHFSSGTQITAWYVAVFENDYTPLVTNTYATPGFTESTAYDESTRPAWTEAGASSKAISNTASKASFTFNATKTIYGGALVGGGSTPSTKNDQAGGGVLFCSSQFSSGSKSVVSTDVLKVSVSLSCADT